MMSCTIAPEINDSMTRFLGYWARKKAKKRMVAMTVKKSPAHPIKEGCSAEMNNTLADPIKPKIIILAAVAKR